jgi:hypothetical protein
MHFNDILLTIYDSLNILNESKEVSLTPPPPRAKFKNGDIVVVRDHGKFSTYHNKKHIPYINKVGVVVGYKNVPGAYTKYTLEFEDKNLLMIHSNFLYGPFKSIQDAKKYEDSNVEFSGVDIVGALEAVEKNERIEQSLKEILTQEPYNFTWLETPQADKRDRYTLYTLAKDIYGNKVTRTNLNTTNKLTTNPNASYHTLEPKKAYNVELFVETELLTYVYNDAKSFVGSFEGKVQDLIAYKDKYTNLLEAYRLLVRNNYKVNDEIFLTYYSDILTREGNNYVLRPSHSFYYNPLLCQNIKTFDSLVVYGEVFVYTSSGQDLNYILYRSPALINGDLNISCYNASTKDADIIFEHGPEVRGEVRLNGIKLEDTERLRSLALMKKHMKYEDDLIDW